MHITRDDVASRRGGALRSAIMASGLLMGGFLPASAAEGVASFYGRSEHGGPTASGERFNMNAMTAAHRTAPLGSHLRVTNLKNGRSVVVRINDRGPFVRGRIIDLSRAAADQLGFISSGVTRVSIEAAEAGSDPATPVVVAAATPAAPTKAVETTASIPPKKTHKGKAAATAQAGDAPAAHRDHAGEVKVATEERDHFLAARGGAN